MAFQDSYFSNHKRRVVLNGKSSIQSSVFLFFLIYIDDLVKNISSDPKLFADDTSLFIVVYEKGTASDQSNRYLKVISGWAYQWKMQFNLDKNKQVI